MRHLFKHRHTHIDTHIFHELITPKNNTMPENEEDRSSLVNRQLPEMVLSTADNPLTAPRPPPENLSAAERIAYRFQVKGNAIST